MMAWPDLQSIVQFPFRVSSEDVLANVLSNPALPHSEHVTHCSTRNKMCFCTVPSGRHIPVKVQSDGIGNPMYLCPVMSLADKVVLAAFRAMDHETAIPRLTGPA